MLSTTMHRFVLLLLAINALTVAAKCNKKTKSGYWHFNIVAKTFSDPNCALGDPYAEIESKNMKDGHCKTWDEPFYGVSNYFRRHYFSGDHPYCYGTCVMESWAGPDCTGNSLGRVGPINHDSQMGGCISGFGDPIRSMKITCDRSKRSFPPNRGPTDALFARSTDVVEDKFGMEDLVEEEQPA